MDELEMMALQGMMGPDMGMDAGMPADPMMDTGGGDPMAVTQIPVPNFAVPAVMELISLLEQTVANESGAMMDPMMASGDMGMDAGMMDF